MNLHDTTIKYKNILIKNCKVKKNCDLENALFEEKKIKEKCSLVIIKMDLIDFYIIFLN